MFAKRITDLRENRNLLQKDIAKIFEVEQATVSNWEKGKRVPDSDMLIKIANFFDVSIDFLLGNDKKTKKYSETEEEIIEKEILKRWLIKSGYMTNFQDLTNEELNKLMDFLITNKEFLK